MSKPSTSYSFRTALPTEAAVIARHRIAMFRDMGTLPAAEEDALQQASIAWFTELLEQGKYVGWFALHEEKIVAGGGIHLRELGPVPGSPYLGRWGYIMNVYTEPEHRRHGLARSLMKLILDWTVAEKLDRVTLTASDFGKPLYEALGLTAINEMKFEIARRT